MKGSIIVQFNRQKLVHEQFFEILSCLNLSGPAADEFGESCNLMINVNSCGSWRHCQQTTKTKILFRKRFEFTPRIQLKVTAGFVIPTLLLLLYTSVASCLFDPWTMASSSSSSSASAASTPWRLLREEEISGTRLMPPPPQCGKLQIGKVQSEENVERMRKVRVPQTVQASLELYLYPQKQE